jgi:hypothetical protein
MTKLQVNKHRHRELATTLCRTLMKIVDTDLNQQQVIIFIPALRSKQLGPVSISTLPVELRNEIRPGVFFFASIDLNSKDINGLNFEHFELAKMDGLE